MIALLTNIAPIALGFIGKLFALKSQAAQENQKLMMQQFAVRDKSINDARNRADKESPMAALNRRVIIFVILSLIIFTQVAPVFFNVPTVVPTVIEGASLLGFELTPDTIEYVTVQAGAVLKFDEVFAWATMIIEFYFGAQLAKGK
ncbi:MAG: hypothetical protein CMI60_04255 [Parvibaculum sp.]|jgi:hypothetical protein|nr:hypothetical protein [Parvibaculum sp.]